MRGGGPTWGWRWAPTSTGRTAPSPSETAPACLDHCGSRFRSAPTNALLGRPPVLEAGLLFRQVVSPPPDPAATHPREWIQLPLGLRSQFPSTAGDQALCPHTAFPPQPMRVHSADSRSTCVSCPPCHAAPHKAVRLCRHSADHRSEAISGMSPFLPSVARRTERFGHQHCRSARAYGPCSACTAGLCVAGQLKIGVPMTDCSWSASAQEGLRKCLWQTALRCCEQAQKLPRPPPWSLACPAT
mmetsp:Transcript_19657/g.40019  ORF Transcript_19657/g.40019 Transcript_19657/m.40019 type:complete len:243 (-) Transcript_19657:163-891(-)